jgi:hypothetical protein
VSFDVVGEIEQVVNNAAGPSVKVRSFLGKTYGRGRWRKLKGLATVRLPNGILRRVFDKHQFAFIDFPQAVRRKILALRKAS